MCRRFPLWVLVSIAIVGVLHASGAGAQSPDSLLACPAGPPATVMVLIFHLDEPAMDHLFGHKSTRTLRFSPAWQGPTLLHAEIARKARVTPAAVSLSCALITAGNTPQHATHADTTGWGFGLGFQVDGAEVRVSVCAAQGLHTKISPAEVFLVRFARNGVPAVLAIRARARGSSEREVSSDLREQQEFIAQIGGLPKASWLVLKQTPGAIGLDACETPKGASF